MTASRGSQRITVNGELGLAASGDDMLDALRTSLPVDPALDKFIMEKREARAKALVEQERHPTLFADLK